MTLLAFLIFLYLTNTGILGMMGPNIIILKGQEPPQGDFNIVNFILMVL
jgi:hypothetical protein